MKQPTTFPKTLVLSFSGIGSNTATGQLLDLLFKGWPKDRLTQLYYGHHPRPGVPRINLANTPPAQALESCRRFAPELIYFRPVDNHPEYAACACDAIRQSDAPLVTHIMDDWPARLGNSPTEQTLLRDLQWAFDRSQARWTICKEMSTAYTQRYGQTFDHLANGIDAADWRDPAIARQPNRPFTIRYAGALAEDMQKQSIADLAQAVSTVRRSGKNVELEIYTMRWFSNIAQQLAAYPGVSAHDLVAQEEYPALLASADAVVLAYNFDPKSIEYTKLSFANKTPECLASGAPVLAYGPTIVPSINYLQTNNLATVVDAHSIPRLVEAITAMVDAPEPYQETARRAKRFALEHHNARTVQRKFIQIMQDAAHHPATPNHTTLKRFTREDDVSLDETQVVFEYFKDAPSGLMVDVGAHHGTAFKPFLKAGWRIHGFEPDPKNRKFLTDRISASPNLTINPQAVSNTAGEKLPFFASEQSTGISSLIPFHAGHTQVATIETTTLGDYCKENAITHMDFLKIDTEGYDLPVLQGLDWSKCNPKVIECEFEDAKTTKIGYEFDDLAKFLLERNYTVYVSEWHPIVRYGIRHQWHALQQYPCKLVNPDSWGNLLAFQDPTPPAQVEQLFLKILTKRNPGTALTTQADAKISPDLPSDNPTRAERPTMNPLANHLGMLKRFVTSRPGQLTMVVGLVILATNTMSQNLELFGQSTLIPWVARIVIFAAALYLIAYLRERTLFDAANASANTGDLETASSLRLIRQEIAALRAATAALEKQLEQHDDKNLVATIQGLETRLEALETTNGKQLKRNVSALRSEIDAHTEDLMEMQQRVVDLKGKLPAIVQMISNLRSDSSNIQ